MKSEEFDGLHEYDFIFLYRTFEIMKAAGKLETFLDRCREDNSKILMKRPVAIQTSERLKAEMPAIELDEDRFREIFGHGPEAIRRGNCPACPYE